MVLAVVGDEWMPLRVRSTHEDRAKIAGDGLHKV
jgi:hypothetical protein